MRTKKILEKACRRWIGDALGVHKLLRCYTDGFSGWMKRFGKVLRYSLGWSPTGCSRWVREQTTWLLKQDNFPINTSSFTRNLLQEHSISTIFWPSRSSDLNITENLWGIMNRRVYRGFRSVETFEELKKEIHNFWKELEDSCILKMYRSILRRLLAVMDAKGKAKKY